MSFRINNTYLSLGSLSPALSNPIYNANKLNDSLIGDLSSATKGSFLTFDGNSWGWSKIIGSTDTQGVTGTTGPTGIKGVTGSTGDPETTTKNLRMSASRMGK